MVVKQTDITRVTATKFEYGVILNGSQTILMQYCPVNWFEYGVILNGSQTFRTKF